MKAKYSFLFSLLVILLAGCSFSLAEDIAPPAGYQSPTPQPTLGTLYPEQAPSVYRGAAIFTEYCASCHGEAGLGNGPLSGQLPVPVAAIGLQDISEQSSPAAWFRVVTEGRQDRSMPSFAGELTEQQRWDVLAYVYQLSSNLTGKYVHGTRLYGQYCATCHGAGGEALASADLTNQAFMAQHTGINLYRAIAEGGGQMPAFSAQLSEDDIHAIVSYVRSLTFDLTAPVITEEPSQPSPQATVVLTTTPGAEPAVTVIPGTPEPTVNPLNAGEVYGKVGSAPGASLPAGMTVSLHGFDNDASGSPQETLTLDGTVEADGRYSFKDVELPEGRVFLVEINADGIYIQSDHVSVEAGASKVELPDVTIYDSITDASGLLVQQVHIILDLSQADSLLVYEIYVLTNPTGKVVRMTSDGTSLPFVPTPEGATPMGIQLTQDSDPVYATDEGFAIPPGDYVYSFLTLFMMPYDGKVTLDQPFDLSTSMLTLLAPQGVKVKGKGLTRGEASDFGTTSYDVYTSEGVEAGGTLSLTMSGTPGETTTAGLDSKNIIVIALGAAGAILIGVGIFLFLRDRKRAAREEGTETGGDEIEAEEDEDVEDEEGSSEDDPDVLMDAIIALDDQFKAGKITRSAYEARRSELKARLKGLL